VVTKRHEIFWERKNRYQIKLSAMLCYIYIYMKCLATRRNNSVCATVYIYKKPLTIMRNKNIYYYIVKVIININLWHFLYWRLYYCKQHSFILNDKDHLFLIYAKFYFNVFFSNVYIFFITSFKSIIFMKIENRNL
jgi:hypothetical protein